MDFNKKRNREFFNEQLLFKTVGILFLVIICVLIIADFRIYSKKRELSLQINAYKEQIEDIKKSSQTLKEEIANADNTDYLEKLGYEQFDQTKPGETEYMFVGDLEEEETASAQEKSWTGWLSFSWKWIRARLTGN